MKLQTIPKQKSLIIIIYKLFAVLFFPQIIKVPV